MAKFLDRQPFMCAARRLGRTALQAMVLSIFAGGAAISQAAIVTLQDGTDGYAGTEDTSLQQDAVNRNWGERTGILSGPINDSGTLRVGLLRFDLTGLSGQFTAVNSMSLKLTVLTTQSHATGSILTASLQKEADGEWVEGTGNFADNQAGSATWNQERHGVSNWVGGAGARGTSIYGSLATQSGMSPTAFPVDSTVTLNFNPAGLPSNVNSLTEIVNLWNTPGNNAGIHLENGSGAAGSNRQYQYYSSEHATVASRPLLQLSATGTISWDIAGGGNWNTSTANWKMGTLVPKVIYENADTVNFTNSAGGVIAIQAGGVSPGGVNVSATSGTYEFTGGAIAGSAALTKSGAGTLILSNTNTNTYSGGTTVSEGVLQIGNGGTGTLGPGNTSIAAGATLRFNTTSYQIDVGGLKYGGSLSGDGDVVIDGPLATHLMRFNGDNSAFAGTLTVLAGSRTSLHAANSSSASAKFVVDGQLSGQAGNGSTYDFGELSGAATGNIGGGGSTNNVNWSIGALDTDSTYHGRLISNGGGLTKVGSGTLRLTNMSHSYTGATNVNGGILQVDGSIATSSGVSVADGAWLAGSGLVPGISGAGLVSPGTSPGILTAAFVDPAGGLDFAFEFTAPGSPNYATPSTSINDVLSLTGATPFTSLLDGDNTVGIYFDVAQISVGDTFRGGFFVDSESYDLLGAIADADWQLFVRGDGGGNVAFNGTNYYPLAALYPNLPLEFSTALENNGQVLQITATPEPASLMIWLSAGLAAMLLGQKLFQRRK